MRYEWYLVRYKGGKFVDKSPHAMSRCEADNLLKLARLNDKGYAYKVVHRKEL